MFLLFHLAGERAKLSLQRIDARGKAGKGIAGSGRLRHRARHRLDLRFDELLAPAGEDAALNRAHFLLEPLDAALDRLVALRRRGRRQGQEQAESDKM
jgi:hypothetical protein